MKSKKVVKKSSNSKRMDIRQAFLGLQKEMYAALSSDREVIAHPGAKGTVTEMHWLEMLRTYLPKRYSADKAFVLDHKGFISDEIDIVIFDQQYSPFLFKRNGANFVPAESVYAVLEVKQDLSKFNLEYAGKKFLSVRNLSRTSAPIAYAGGVYKPKPLSKIISGVLTTDSKWKGVYAKYSEKIYERLPITNRFDLGCVLARGAFSVTEVNKKNQFELSEQEDALVFFFLCLLDKLQQLGTVTAIDIPRYREVLKRRK